MIGDYQTTLRLNLFLFNQHLFSFYTTELSLIFNVISDNTKYRPMFVTFLLTNQHPRASFAFKKGRALTQIQSYGDQNGDLDLL